MKTDRTTFLILLPIISASIALLSPAGRPNERFLYYGQKAKDPNAELFEAKSTKIGTQIWTTENLDVSNFRNGDVIAEADSYDAWEKACINGTPVWCYYKNDKVKSKGMGKLYNFWAVIDKRKLASEGWHVPSDAEWAKLVETLGGNETAGKSMKSAKGWKNNQNGDNASGFNGIPTGYRSHEKPAYYGGPFFEAGSGGYWWSSTRYLVDNGYCRILSYKNSGLDKSSFVLTAGLSIRLVKD